jgi:hypothetical protein
VVRHRHRQQRRRPTIESLLAKLQKVSEVGPNQWSSCCPAHPDFNPSLSIHLTPDGQLLFYCHAGCDVEEQILPELGLKWSDVCGHAPLPRSNRGSAPASLPIPKSEPADQAPKVPASPIFVSAADAKHDWADIARRAIRRLTTADLTKLGQQLTIPTWALKQVHVGVTQVQDGVVYTFPEFDGKGNITGIAIRFADGKKRCLHRSQRGLTLPKDWQQGDGPILIVEGASDTAALVAMGLNAVGRPSAGGGIDALLQLLEPIPLEREIIVLGEFDAKPDGSWPGREGALKVAHALADGLHRPITTSLPPSKAKDIRAWRADQCPKA